MLNLARLDLFGPDLAAFMKRAARGLTRIGAFGDRGTPGPIAAASASTSTPFGTIVVRSCAAPSSSCFLRFSLDSVTIRVAW